MGIATKPINKIFDPFFTTKEGHNGIGLSVLKVMIEDKLKSNIKVESEYNKTLFTVELINLE